MRGKFTAKQQQTRQKGEGKHSLGSGGSRGAGSRLQLLMPASSA